MRINDIIGLFAALIGTTTTLLGAWAYIRSHPTLKKEMLRASFAFVVIMVVILGSALLISRATTIKVNGQGTVPLPAFLAPFTPTPGKTTPTPVLTSTPKGGTPPSVASPGSTPESSPTQSLSSTPESSLTPPPASTPGTSLTPIPKKG